MNNASVIGNNINLYIKRNNLDYGSIISELGMTENDFIRVLSGRLLLSGKELQTISAVLGVNVNDLMIEKNINEYSELIHCMGKINDYKNVDKIIEFIDDYITLKEDTEM